MRTLAWYIMTKAMAIEPNDIVAFMLMRKQLRIVQPERALTFSLVIYILLFLGEK